MLGLVMLAVVAGLWFRRHRSVRRVAADREERDRTEAEATAQEQVRQREIIAEMERDFLRR